MLLARIIVYIALSSVIMPLTAGRLTLAQETVNYGQQILPIDCVYEVIDVGTQTLRYLTPETCPDPPTDEPTSASPELTPTQNQDPNQVPVSNDAQPTRQSPINSPSPGGDATMPIPEADKPEPAVTVLLDTVAKRYDVILIALTIMYIIIMLVKQRKKPAPRAAIKTKQTPGHKSTNRPKTTRKSSNKAKSKNSNKRS